jgi:peptide/nickel transport system substrate-binding protein
MKKKFCVFSIFMMVALILSACGPAATTAPSVTEQPINTQAPPALTPTSLPPTPTQVPPTPTEAPLKVLKIASAAAITTWDPVKSFSTEVAYMNNMYEQLLRMNPPGSAEEFTPLLATSWESNEDGTVWTFHLRPNVKFHDGEPVNAEAVKMSIEAIADHGGAAFIWWMLDTIEVVDDLTVKFNLTSSARLDWIASSADGSRIISPKALETAAANPDYFETGVDAGTGPYILESYKPDQELVFTQNKDYWGGWKPNQFDKVYVQFVTEGITQQQLLDGGQVDLVTTIPPENIAAYKENPNFTYDEEESMFNYLVFFNTLRPPLDNIKVRQALSYAMPYEDIINIARVGLGTQARGPVPKGVWPWSEKVPQYTYDLEKAKTLLAEAGFPDGGFNLNMWYVSNNDTSVALVPLIKDSFAQIGVEVTLVPMLWSPLWEQAKADPANAFDMLPTVYWPTYADAGSDNLWSLFYWTEAPFFNLSFWKNDTYNTILDEAISETFTDPASSQAKYIEAMKILYDEAPGAYLFDTKTVFLIPTYIEGFKYNLNYPFVPYFYYELTTTK